MFVNDLLFEDSNLYNHNRISWVLCLNVPHHTTVWRCAPEKYEARNREWEACYHEGVVHTLFGGFCA